MVKNGRVKIFKEKGTDNVADAGTKYLSALKMDIILDKLGFAYMDGASNLALKVQG